MSCIIAVQLQIRFGAVGVLQCGLGVVPPQCARPVWQPVSGVLVGTQGKAGVVAAANVRSGGVYGADALPCPLLMTHFKWV